VEFSIDHAVLTPALASVARLAPTRAVRPVLSAVLIEAADGKVTLGATDLQASAVTALPAAVGAEGRVAVPARYLAELLRRIPGGLLRCASLEDGSGLRVSWERSQFSVQGFDPREYPPLPLFPARAERALSRPDLRRAITHTVFAAAQEETARALLTGVELRFSGDALFAVATDGYQVATYATRPEVPRPAEDAVVLPASMLGELARMLGDEDLPCEIARDGNHVLFRSGDSWMALRALEGKFFPVLDLIPKEFPYTIRTERLALVGACERVGLVAEGEPPYALLLRAQNDTVTLQAERAGVGSAEEAVPAEVSGETPLLAFNVRQLLEGLRLFAGDRLELQLSGAKSVARFVDPADARWEYMQMPLELPS
jgi:DNA polymerase-3 subunit beta